MKRKKVFYLILLIFLILILYTQTTFLNSISISVIIPIFNAQKFLPFCLNSIISQSLKNIEILCIDDGSTDNSLKILKSYQKIDKRIIIFQQKNQGSGKARNIGIKMSKGKYIAFMDSDDLYPNNNTLEFMFKNAKKNDAFICGGGLKHFILNNNIIKLLDYSNDIFHKNGYIDYYDYQYDFYYQRFIYSKKFIKKNRLYFKNYLRYQDPPFFIKVMGLAKKFYALTNITYLKRSNNIIIWNKKKIIDVFKGIKECLFLSEKMNLNKLYCKILNRLKSKSIINPALKYIKKKELTLIIYELLITINLDIINKENQNFSKNDYYKIFKIKNISLK